jgi:Lon protease-like protein
VESTGCTAEILRTIRQYPDGRLDILTEGRRAFRLLNTLSDEAYHQGSIEYLRDTPAVADAGAEAAMVERFEQCHVLLFGQPWERSDTSEAFALSYRMAGQLPIEPEKRQALLEMRSEIERQSLLLAWLDQLLPKLAQRHQGRRIAGGNGHPVN